MEQELISYLISRVCILEPSVFSEKVQSIRKADSSQQSSYLFSRVVLSSPPAGQTLYLANDISVGKKSWNILKERTPAYSPWTQTSALKLYGFREYTYVSKRGLGSKQLLYSPAPHPGQVWAGAVLSLAGAAWAVETGGKFSSQLQCSLPARSSAVPVGFAPWNVPTSIHPHTQFQAMRKLCP